MLGKPTPLGRAQPPLHQAKGALTPGASLTRASAARLRRVEASRSQRVAAPMKVVSALPQEAALRPPGNPCRPLPGEVVAPLSEAKRPLAGPRAVCRTLPAARAGPARANERQLKSAPVAAPRWAGARRNQAIQVPAMRAHRRRVGPLTAPQHHPRALKEAGSLAAPIPITLVFRSKRSLTISRFTRTKTSRLRPPKLRRLISRTPCGPPTSVRQSTSASRSARNPRSTRPAFTCIRIGA